MKFSKTNELIVSCRPVLKLCLNLHRVLSGTFVCLSFRVVVVFFVFVFVVVVVVVVVI